MVKLQNLRMLAQNWRGWGQGMIHYSYKLFSLHYITVLLSRGPRTGGAGPRGQGRRAGGGLFDTEEAEHADPGWPPTAPGDPVGPGPLGPVTGPSNR